jgi:hypothetical protein
LDTSKDEELEDRNPIYYEFFLSNALGLEIDELGEAGMSSIRLL